MWNRLLSFILCFTLIFGTVNIASADPVRLPDVVVPSGEADVGAALSPMKKGDKAPFTGVLLSPKAVATLIAQMGTLQEQIKIEVDHAVAVNSAQCDFKTSEQKTTSDADKAILQAQLEARKKDIAALDDQLKKEQSSRSNVPLWTGLGAVGGIVVTVLTVFAVSRATK